METAMTVPRLLVPPAWIAATVAPRRLAATAAVPQ